MPAIRQGSGASGPGAAPGRVAAGGAGVTVAPVAAAFALLRSFAMKSCAICLGLILEKSCQSRFGRHFSPLLLQS